MSDAQKKRDEENTQYEATSADLAAAVTGINKTMESVESSAPASFEQLKATVRKSLVIADVLDISPKHQRMMNALLQEEDAAVKAHNSYMSSKTSQKETAESDLSSRK